MQNLDESHKAKAKKDKGMMAMKVRRVGTLPAPHPPSEAPTWTVKCTGQFSLMSLVFNIVGLMYLPFYRTQKSEGLSHKSRRDLRFGRILANKFP